MEKAYRIKKNSDFQFIYKKGKSVANRQFVIYTQPNKALNHFRLGIIVIARQPAKDMDTLQIQASLEHVLKIAKVFNKRV